MERDASVTNGDAVVGINFPNQGYQGFTAQQFQNNTSNSGNTPTTLGNQASNNGSLTDNTYSYIDDLHACSVARTRFRVGVQALRYQNNYPTSNNNGYLGTELYTGAFSANPAAGTDGYGAADFLLDRVSQAEATLGSANVGQRQWRAAGYACTDYKATSASR